MLLVLIHLSQFYHFILLILTVVRFRLQIILNKQLTDVTLKMIDSFGSSMLMCFLFYLEWMGNEAGYLLRRKVRGRKYKKAPFSLQKACYECRGGFL